MNLSYENEMNLAFDKPLKYKDLLLYPAKLPYYSIFAAADECLDISRVDEKNIDFLRLPYLEYMYEKSLVDEDFKNKWNLLICIMHIVLGEDQPFDILRQEGRLCIRVYQRSDNYELLNKECTILQESFLNNYDKKKTTKKELEELKNKISELRNKMNNVIIIGSEDFEEIKQLIMLQHDVKAQHFDAKTEKFLYEMKEKLHKAQGNKNKNSPTLEDLISVVAYSLQKEPKDLEDMTIRRFNRYLDIVLSKDDYYMYKKLELSGMIKLKMELPHWIKHYEPKGKFDDILVKDNGLMNAATNGGKI